jgi:hypothetical protein
MRDEPDRNFGKRRLQPLPEEAPSRKRSNQIALLLMGTMAVGGGAYALMPGERCDPNRPAIEQPACRQNSSSSSSSGSHYYGSSGGSSSSGSAARSNFASTGSSSSTGYGSASSGSSSVARSGFGSFASHFSGGG